jgi:hypothetical protein
MIQYPKTKEESGAGHCNHQSDGQKIKLFSLPKFDAVFHSTLEISAAFHQLQRELKLDENKVSQKPIDDNSDKQSEIAGMENDNPILAPQSSNVIPGNIREEEVLFEPVTALSHIGRVGQQKRKRKLKQSC